MNLPNKLTVARIIAVPFFMLLYSMDAIWPALILYIAACITDFLDGKLARKLNLITNFGKIMDPLADKILVYAAFCMFIERGIMPSWILVVILTREFLIAGIRTLAAANGTVIAAAMSGKIKTTLQMIAVPMMIADPVMAPMFSWYHTLTLVMIMASVVMTVYSGIEYTVKNIEVFK